MTLLDARGLTRHFGGIKAVDGVDLAIPEGQIRALIGPNGAGKTTLVSLLTGRVEADAGTVTFLGQDVTDLPAHKRIALGMGYTFQITSIFANLGVRENVALALQRVGGRARVDDILATLGLSEYAGQIAGDLAYGHQRLLEIAMGVAQKPRLLILDEPTQGLAAGEISDFIALVQKLSETTTILLIEHNMEVVMALATEITVLERGRVIAEGPPAEIRADRAVQEAYLGS